MKRLKSTLTVIVLLLFSTQLYATIYEDGNIIKDTFKTKKISNGNTKSETTPPITKKINFKEYKSRDNSRITENKAGLYLSGKVQSNVDNDRATNPDIVYSVATGKKGLYTIETNSSLNENGENALGGKTTKYDSLFMKIKIGKNSAVKRVIYVPWAVDKKIYRSILGNFYFDGSIQNINIWLPQGVILNKIIIKEYTPPAVLKDAQSYEPSIIPPQTRPRLWVNASSIDTVRSNLKVKKNKAIWDNVKKIAEQHYKFPYSTNQKIIKADTTVEKIMTTKAFYYLMEKDSTVGREAIDIAKKYIETIEFGNLLDVTRDIGSVIYNVSLIYDWCYDLLTEKEKELFVTRFKTLARDMEIGWPPFKQAVTYGHGNEGQLSRYLLAMTIAIYDEDPIPYKYTSYRILKELVPMKRFEYQSPRHVQGVAYGTVRYMYDLTAGLLFKKMSNNDIFNKNILDVYKSFWYRRLTNKSAFTDGDDFRQYSEDTKMGILPITHNAYSRHFDTNTTKLSQSDMALYDYHASSQKQDPVMVLLLGDPNSENYKVLTKDEISKLLPLTSFTGKATGSMTARTGWDLAESTNDVVVDIKGGGYKLGNHQHADAGSFQVSYKGIQVVDLGQYHYYGTPYDRKFNKRSIAHSMMLVVDPNEKNVGDGGTIQHRKYLPPATPTQAKEEPDYSRGQVISESTAPENIFDPDFSYYALDLASAYSEKISTYQKKSVFINLKNEDIPAVLIMLDTIKTSNKYFKKYWQINTLNKPNIDSNGIITLKNKRGKKGEEKEGLVVVNILKPSVSNREIKLFSEQNSTKVFGTQYTPPFSKKPEANGTRIMISPSVPSQYDEFLTVFTMKKPNTKSLPITYTEASDHQTYHISVGRKILVVMNKTNSFMTGKIGFTIKNNTTKLFVSGLKTGKWALTKAGNSKPVSEVVVGKGTNTAYFESLSSGYYSLESK